MEKSTLTFCAYDLHVLLMALNTAHIAAMNVSYAHENSTARKLAEKRSSDINDVIAIVSDAMRKKID